MPQHSDILSSFSTHALRSLAVTYFQGRGASRMTRSQLVPFFLEEMVKEENATLASGLRRAAATSADPHTLVASAHRKMRDRYGTDLFNIYLTSAQRMSDTRLCTNGIIGTQSVQPHSSDATADADQSEWPSLVEQAQKDRLLADYRAGITIEVAATCAVCSRRTFTKDVLYTRAALSCTRVAAQDLPLELLRISDPHILERPGEHFKFEDASLNGIALDRNGVHCSPTETFLDVCNECIRDLSKADPKMPALALANGNIRGFLPESLRDCTWLEERLCAKYLGTAYIFRLYDCAAPGRPEERARVMKGHSCAFPLNTIATASKLPWTLGHSSTLLSCLIIGPRKPRHSDLRKVFNVRKAKVIALLAFLRANFKDYPSIPVNEDALEELPEDDVPDALMRHVVYEASDTVHELFDSETAGLEPHPADSDSAGVDTKEGTVYLEHHGLVDVNGVAVPSQVRAASAFASATGSERPELIIHYGSSILSDYNNPQLFPGMFPLLFPWGTGGFESARAVSLSFNRQAELLLDLADPAFRRHWSFIFVVANIKSRRAIHLGSRLACKSRDFQAVTESLARLDADTVKRISEHLQVGGTLDTLVDDERRIFTLLKKCELLSAHVPGSRAVMNRARADIRAYIGEHGIFQLFLTLNPHPEHSPLFQVFLGDSTIDLTQRIPLLSTLAERTVQVADDPVAAADYFHFQVAATFQYLFGWDVRNGRSTADGGILGRLAAFFMVREHTMRGQLHGHILIWLQGGLNPSDLRVKLRQDQAFQERYLGFMDDIIWHHLPTPLQVSSSSAHDVSQSTSPVRHARQEMPPSPSQPDFRSVFEDDHRVLGEELQRHRCRKTCFKGGRASCRFLFPHDEHAESSFDPDSNAIQLRVKDATINYHNPLLLVATRHNHDIKSVQSGKSSVAAAAYITSYATKSEETPMNQVSLINTVYKRIQDHGDFNLELKDLLTRCVMQFGRERQLHAQQVATYVRDLGDTWHSHRTVPMLSGSMLKKTVRLYGPVRSSLALPDAPVQEAEVQSAGLEGSMDQDAIAAHQGDDDFEQDSDVELNEMEESGGEEPIAGFAAQPSDGAVEDDEDEGDDEMLPLSSGGIAHQVDSYLHRGSTLDNLTFYEFVKFCNITKKPKKFNKNHHHLRDSHPNAKTHCHRYTPERPNGIPRAVFTKVPRSDGTSGHGDDFCATMLCHFQAFSVEQPLKTSDVTYEQAYARANFPQWALRIMSNWQALAECDDARDAEQLLRRKREATRGADFDEVARPRHDGAMDDVDADIDIAALQARASRQSQETMLFLSALNANGWFNSISPTASSRPVTLNQECPAFTTSRRKQWAKEQKKLEREEAERAAIPRATTGVLAADLGLDVVFVDPTTTSGNDADFVEEPIEPFTQKMQWRSTPPQTLIQDLVTERNLNPAQALAFRIVARHFFEEQYGHRHSPLRLLMHGEAGTGKTVVVRLLRELLDRYGKGKEIMFLAPTGKAACAIGGVTQHSAFALDVRRKGLSNEDLTHLRDGASAKRMRYLQETFKSINWLFFDEVSMTSSETLADIDQALRIGRHNMDEPFGGANVIFAGDLCQLPPVASTPLYVRESPSVLQAEIRTKIELGRAAWTHIDTVVEFKDQMRMQDRDMAATLSRLRMRQCTAEDCTLLNDRVLSASSSALRAFPNAIALARTNETVRVLNLRKAAVQAQSTANTLVISHAYDHSTAMQSEADRQALLSYNGSGKARGGLGRVPLYMGMPVVYRGPNQSVALGVTNGAFATVAGWDLTPDAFELPVPRGVILKFENDAQWCLSGLQPGCLPIPPHTSTFGFIKADAEEGSQRITRKQLPIQPGFAMTIHSAQGITTQNGIIIDLRAGGFEAYVAASRARTRPSVFLLATVTTEQLNSPPLPASLVLELQRLEELARRTAVKHDHDSWRIGVGQKRHADEEPGQDAGPSQRRRM